MPLTRLPAACLSFAATAMIAGPTTGQDYPNKPIRILAGPIGGGGDFVARIIAQGISGPLGQSVVVDNRGSSTVAAEVAAKSQPDGHTLNISGSSFWTLPLLSKVSYDVLRDYAPVTIAIMAPGILVVNPALPANSVKDLIAVARAKPGELNYASSLNGGSSHLAVELFKSMASINVTRIVYKGGAAAMPDLIGGRVQMTIDDGATLMPHIKGAKLKALAVTTAEPSTLYPDLVTVSAAGVPGYEAVTMQAMFAPAKTPAAVIGRVNQETVRVLTRSDIKDKFLSTGSEVVAGPSEQLAAKIKAETERLGKLIRDIGLRAE